ncbi:replication initiator protein A [Clostridium sp. ZS2-4]|uniref:replication initiator protein A n=1 Tax=Clostridium sp. ZS2-4 TaxID=2987703 RepID=UPI00227B57EF|nr:replication initiator protein A [Clostridium sp. ZS2-4]MCY6356189.1 replication initiator protein A [Clostridium sp. ZS2-4]
MEINIENNKQETKVIYQKTSVVDINVAENPLFIGSTKEVITIGELEKQNDLSSGVKRIIEAKKKKLKQVHREEEYKHIPVSYKNWVDRKNKSRGILIIGDIPTLTTMNVWNGLVALYIHKTAPLVYNDSKKMYDIESDTMHFTMYELAKIMNLSTAGNILNSLMDEILTLKNTTYYSLNEGIFYIKKDESYLKSKIEGFSLILDAKFQSEKRIRDKKVTTKCKVQFNRMIIDNIKHEYIKYLKPNEYFSLPSRGYTRRLYLYIKGNMHQSNKEPYTYIKRSIEVLSRKLPLKYKYISEFKRKVKKPLETFVKTGLIKDYFYGDEILINGIKEHSLYFIFKGTKQDVIDRLSMKYKSAADDEENDEFTLYIPKNIKKKLINLGASEDFTNKIVKEKDKWEIIKYILWLEEEKNKRKIANPAGLLNFALTTNNVKLELTHRHIVDYVEQERQKSKTSKMDLQQQTQNEYNKYIDKEIKKFKKDNIGAYELMYENLLAVLKNDAENKISEYKLLLVDDRLTEQDRLFLEKQKQEWLDFQKKQEKSELFKKKLQNNISQMLVLKCFEDFKNEEIAKMK